MKICGIIAEYNPLHNGHVYQIQKARELSGCDYLIVALSGSFVQRGEVASYNKFERARWAILAGADAVFEIPTVYVLQGANGFALGGVSVLQNACANYISFGSENNNLSLIQKAADSLQNPTSLFQKNIAEQLAMGKSYPRAINSALRSIDEFKDVSELFDKPNFMLGVEYFKAMSTLNYNPKAIIIKRLGQDYNEENLNNSAENQGFASASAVRKSIIQNQNAQNSLNNLNILIKKAIPNYVYNYINSCEIADISNLESIILYNLRKYNFNINNLSNIFGISEGFENKLIQASSSKNYAELLENLKSKRYTLARIRRIICSLLLNIDKDLVQSANISRSQYLRVLALKKGSEKLLKIIQESKTNNSNKYFNIISNKKDFDKLPENSINRLILEKDFLATDILGLAYSSGNIKASRQDFTQKFNLV